MEKKDTLGTLSSVPLAIPRPMSFRAKRKRKEESPAIMA